MIQFDDRGLLTAVVQDAGTQEVLMVAHMNREALMRTIAGPHVWFYSRSRKTLWEKGSTSGDYLNVVDLKLDCDGDALVVMVEPVGAACHTGEKSCFHQSVDADSESTQTSGTGHSSRIGRCHPSTRRRHARRFLHGKITCFEGTSRVAQKVIEEAGETGLAAADGSRESVAPEMADLFYNCVTLLESVGAPMDEVWAELARRRR